MDALLFSVTFTALAFLSFLLCRTFGQRLALSAGVLFAAYIGLDDFVTGFPTVTKAVDLIGGQWNWSGKVYSILLAVGVILALRIRPQAIGLTLAQRNLTASLIALPLLTAVGVGLGLAFHPDPPSAETLAFQALMPSIAEELAYRGIAPALLLGAIRGADAPQSTPWTVVVISAVMFSTEHGLSYSHGAFAFDWIPAAYTFLGGIVYGWLRFATGSLAVPLLAHSLGNVVFQLTALIGR